MDELQTIREALEEFAEDGPRPGLTVALAALSRLEARARTNIDTADIVERIWKHELLPIDSAALIGQYAYRYCEEIRKDRDHWRKLVIDVYDTVSDDARAWEGRGACTVLQ